MTRAETLAAIAALPVTDAVRQHATRLMEGLPEWCPMPTTCDHMLGAARLTWGTRGRWMSVCVEDGDRGLEAWFTFEQTRTNYADIRNLLRQLTCMVALTNKGG